MVGRLRRWVVSECSGWKGGVMEGDMAGYVHFVRAGVNAFVGVL